MPEKLWPKIPQEPTPPSDKAEVPPAAAAERKKPPDPVVQAVEEARKVEEPLIEKLRRQERPTTIGLEQSATMVDLFDAIQRAAKKVSVAERESGRFRLHLWDNFTPADVAEVFRLEDRVDAIQRKLPSDITDEDRKLLALKVADFLESKGISPEDIAAHLPIKFRKKKKGR
ncbi:hypothetical protein HYW67_01275 [Candidatus Parcubacteria bacterium]|nr:hypothetical protein [Candidatus Parcubacteria bacterium]